MAFLLLLGVTLPFVSVPNIATAVFASLALTAVYVFIIVRFVSDATRIRLSLVKHIALLLGAAALWWMFDTHLSPAIGAQLRVFAQTAHPVAGVYPDPPASMLFNLFLVHTITDILLLSSAVLGGALVGRLIDEPNMLAPICGVIAVIDIWGVLFGGIVAQMMEKAPTVSSKALASLPAIGAARHVPRELQIHLPDVGAGDYLFLGLLFAAMHINRMNVKGAQKWIIPLIVVALWGVTFGVPALPGLLFIGLGAAIPNVAWFRFTKDEKKALVVAGVFVLFLAGGLGMAAPYIVKAAQTGEPAKPPGK